MKKLVWSICLIPLLAWMGVGLARAQSAPIGELAGLLQGTNPPGSRLEETALGDVAADAIRTVLGVDVALLNGGAIRANLQGGEVTGSDLQMAFPKDEALVTASVTGAQLRTLLEAGVSQITVDENDQVDWSASASDGFPQISGFAFVYDPSAPSGERVTELEREGKPVEEDAVLLLACPESMAAGDYGYPMLTDCRKTAETVRSALAAYLEGTTVEVPRLGRITRIGTADDTILDQIPTPIFWGVIVVLILGSISRLGKREWLDV